MQSLFKRPCIGRPACSRIRAHEYSRQSVNMLEINPIIVQIKDQRERTEALRRYL